MNNVEASIEIFRDNKKLQAINVMVPIWARNGDNGKVYISIPFFGLETFGHSNEDCDVAIEEAIKCFCLLVEQKGLGLEDELSFLGWEKVSENAISHNSIFNVEPKTTALKSLMQTGQQKAVAISL